MALKTLNDSQTQLLSIFSNVTGNLDEMTTAIKSYIGLQIGISSDELEVKIEAGDKEVKDLMALNLEKFKAFQLLLDKWDGEEDGTFNPQQTLIELAQDISEINGTVSSNTSGLGDLARILDSEIDNRVSQGHSLEDSIASAKATAASLISAMETTVNGIIDRVSSVENRIDELVTSVNTFADGMESVVDGLKKSTAKFVEVQTEIDTPSPDANAV